MLKNKRWEVALRCLLLVFILASVMAALQPGNAHYAAVSKLLVAGIIR